jgi:hypothetical protein
MLWRSGATAKQSSDVVEAVERGEDKRDRPRCCMKVELALGGDFTASLWRK